MAKNKKNEPEIESKVEKAIEKSLKQKVEPIKNDVDRMSRMVQEISVWKAPIPRPEDIKKYDEVYPGAAETIFGQFRKQSDHRIEIETKVIEGGLASEKRGQIMAFILFLMLIGGGIFLMAIGKDGIGLTTALTGLATSIGLFLTQKSKANKELKSKALKETQDK